MGILERSIPLLVTVESIDPPTQSCRGTVSSTSGGDSYSVSIQLRQGVYSCGCTDHTIRHRTCKHIVALLLAVRRQIKA